MNQEPPASGMSPIPMNPGTKVAASEAMRTSHAHASESPAPATGPLIAAMHRLLERADRADVRVVGPLERLADAAGKLGELLQVLAGAEAATGAGDDDRAHLGVGRLVERLAQSAVERAVEGVEDLGPVERDREHRRRRARSSTSLGQSLSPPFRLEERAHRVLRLVAQHREREPVARVADGLVPGEVAPDVQLLLRVARRLRELRGELLDPLVDGRVELRLGHGPVDEPPLRGLRRRDLVAEEDDLPRAPVADHELEPLRRASRRHRPVLEADVPDEGGVDHHGEVARHLQLVAAADRDPVDARDRRLADLAQPVVRVLERAEPLPVLAAASRGRSSSQERRSAPTQNARPVPVTTTARTSSSHDASSHARAISRSIRKSNAFRTSGRLSRIVARGGAFS